ncbi:siderophore-interacting protein [Chitinophaga oryzae]|uniref:Siderophore-interacting protein n=1 Tax=Chitinophaga oryzae TaxID=2725414 RepID=A0AAE6ZIQ4_9BACT|nr:siderophore-interacting protein [Chitinophaga oryzae]QJB32887.1 siderophore-interacting protein [Chitinophaga oryzae]
MSRKTIQAELKVKRKTTITPHYIRITLTGDEVPLFANTTPGANNKIFIPPAGMNKVHFPGFDDEKRQWIHAREDVRPVVRTYTHRGLDAAAKEMYIDFVVHGDNGPASAWAMHCQPGDVLGVAMHDMAKALVSVADWYFLIGDATAIPVLSAILESLPAHAKGRALIEVHGEEDVQAITAPPGVSIDWLFNDSPEDGSLLACTARREQLPAPGESKFAYVAAEFSTVKALRGYFRKDLHWTSDELDAFAYWKAGKSEDSSAVERHKENELYETKA